MEGENERNLGCCGQEDRHSAQRRKGIHFVREKYDKGPEWREVTSLKGICAIFFGPAQLCAREERKYVIWKRSQTELPLEGDGFRLKERTRLH